MNFIPGKIEYDADAQIYWTEVFYSSGKQESSIKLGATEAYLRGLFKLETSKELNKGLLNKWLKLSLGDLLKVASLETYKMYATTPIDLERGLQFLSK